MPRYGVPGGVSLLAHFLFVYNFCTQVAYYSMVIGDRNWITPPSSLTRCHLPCQGRPWHTAELSLLAKGPPDSGGCRRRRLGGLGDAGYGYRKLTL